MLNQLPFCQSTLVIEGIQLTVDGNKNKKMNNEKKHFKNNPNLSTDLDIKERQVIYINNYENILDDQALTLPHQQ